MTSILLGQLAKQIDDAFKADGQIPITGTLTRSTVTGLDEFGDPIVSETVYTVRGFVDSYSDYIRATAGIPQGDRKVSIFGASLPVEPQIEDVVTLSGYGPLKIRNLESDPAKALYVCQSFPVDGSP